MILNKRGLKKLGESLRVIVTKEQEYAILERFGEEPWPYDWSEQDIVIQILNFLGCGEFVKSVQDNSDMSFSRLDDYTDGF
jgi:hypothetical protein